MDNDGIIKGTLLVKEANDRAGSSAEDRQTYASSLIDYLRRNGHTITAGRLTISCAEKFGFCWGVDKAVEIVQQVIDSYPGKQIWILNQIIHNPAVNRDFVSRGAKFIKGSYAEPDGFEKVTSDDVAIIPAFSAEVEDIDRLKQIVEENEIEQVVLGLPVNMDDSEGAQARRARAFGRELAQRIPVELHLQDERLSTAAADEMLAESGLTQKKRKARRDMLAACDILRSFLDHKHQMSLTDQESRDEQGI